MDAYDNSIFPELSRRLGQREVADRFATLSAGRDEAEMKKLTTYGEKLHRHLENSFPSIARKTSTTD
jgi:hypothetical protein